ncbi:MAG: DNA polymerase Y family protein [Phycisphaerae bacterium]|nr:DNA polymerase Y family protein [Planctomycetota bacterium]MBM4109850.1 DNA polymerase Y family protein [Phycisphaerae bacterium]
MQRFLVITLPHWSVTARARLVQAPVVVVVRRKGALMVHAASRQARADGVERGMPLAQAKALLQCEPHELEHDPAADHRALHTLARWCHRISPLVQLVHDDDPAALVIDLTGLERVHRGEDRLLVRLRSHMDRFRVECTLWTASTQAAASAAGWAAPSGHDGIIKHGEERWRTRACPVSALRIDPELVAMLHEVNVRTLDDLRQVQRAQVAPRFGQRLLDRLDAIQGLVLEPFRAIRCVPDIQGEVIFDGPCPQVEALCRAMQSCFEQICTQLQDRGRGARTFTVRVQCSDLPQHAWTIRCTQPIRSWDAVRPLVLPSLQDLPLGHGVEGVQVIARSLRRVAPVQVGLQGTRTAGEHGALWIDSLRERFGADAVCVPRVRAVRRHAWHEGTVAIDAFTEGDRDGVDGVNRIDDAHGMHGVDPTRASMHALASEPSCPWPRPERITVTRHGPDAPWPTPPAHFLWRGTAWHILGCQGPQRLAGAWWHAQDPGTRDHWRVHAAPSTVDPSGDHAWLALVRHDDGSWWVHGAWT